MPRNEKPSGAVTLNGFNLKLIFNHLSNYNVNYKSNSDLKTRQKGKVIKLFRCFDSDRCFSAEMMSGFLIICKNCLASEHIENEHSQQRFVEKMLNKISVFLRRRI